MAKVRVCGVDAEVEARPRLSGEFTSSWGGGGGLSWGGRAPPSAPSSGKPWPGGGLADSCSGYRLAVGCPCHACRALACRPPLPGLCCAVCERRAGAVSRGMEGCAVVPLALRKRGLCATHADTAGQARGEGVTQRHRVMHEGEGVWGMWALNG